MNAVKSEVGEEEEDLGMSAAQYAMLIRKVYELKNPAKLDDLERLLRKHQGREHELYRNVCDKYEVNADAFAAQKVLGETHGNEVDMDDAGLPILSSKAYAVLVQEMLMLHNPKKIRDIGALLHKYRNAENT